MSDKRKKAWWDELPPRAGGDVIIGNVGDAARGVAIGKGITQQVYEIVGQPQADDKAIVEQALSRLAADLRQRRAEVGAAAVDMAEFQMKLLQGELTKTEESQTPSASTITQIGDWLLDNVPAVAEGLASLFATPAVGKVVGRAGAVAVEWVRGRFGGRTPTASPS